MAPGFESVPLMNVTGKPDVPDSFTPLTVESEILIFGVCTEYTSKFELAVCGKVSAFAVGCVNNLKLILYFVSPAPVPDTVVPSSVALLV